MFTPQRQFAREWIHLVGRHGSARQMRVTLDAGWGWMALAASMHAVRVTASTHAVTVLYDNIMSYEHLRARSAACAACAGRACLLSSGWISADI